MILLHIAHMGTDPFAGVNVAVRSFLAAQSPLAETALLNVAGVKTEGADRSFSLGEYPAIASLPVPFCRPDLIVFHELYRPRFLGLSREADRLGIPYIIVPHGGLTRKAQSIKRLKKAIANFLLFDRYIRHARAIQFLSERELQESREQKKGFLCTNGVERLHRARTWEKPLRRMIYIGRLDVHIKGLDLMLEAAAQCKALLLEKQITLSLYGPDEGGGHAILREKIRKLALTGVAEVHGPVTGSEKEAVLTSGDLFLQTSRSEGMSMGILEALSWGLPCILTEGTAMTDLLNRYQAGWACKTEASAIAQAIRRAVREEADLNAKSAGAIALVKDNFLMETVTRDTLARYRQIAAGPLEEPHVSD